MHLIIERRLIMIIGVFLVLFLGPLLILSQSTGTVDDGGGKGLLGDYKDFWIVRLALNLLGYATIVVPGYLLIRHFKNSDYLKRAGQGLFPKIVRLCVQGSELEVADEEEAGAKPDPTPPKEQPFLVTAGKLGWCVAGLLIFYLSWGMLQERVMAFEYGGTNGEPTEKFKDSQFLVFMNRILAFTVGSLVVYFTRQPKHTAPAFKYSYSSFSNIMSSWCQYEALKFVSFPTQVLAKASKVIPVMLMGKLVSRKSYNFHEYVSAVMISIGVAMFILTSRDAVKDKGTVTTASGVVILLGYLLFDSFTSNWQGELFRTYKMSPIQMMVGVNLFSVLFTFVSLLEQGGFTLSLAFMGRHPLFVFHVCGLSVCSAVGQLFIFHTISEFGPVVFTIIMTTRQAVALLLSCIYYGHPVTIIGVCGVFIVFAAIALRIYCNQRMRQIKAAKSVISTSGSPNSGK